MSVKTHLTLTESFALIPFLDEGNPGLIRIASPTAPIPAQVSLPSLVTMLTNNCDDEDTLEEWANILRSLAEQIEEELV